MIVSAKVFWTDDLLLRAVSLYTDLETPSKINYLAFCIVDNSLDCLFLENNKNGQKTLSKGKVKLALCYNLNNNHLKRAN